jgi:two-component system, cell cycle sensor histidine kinase and response regulator CckA
MNSATSQKTVWVIDDDVTVLLLAEAALTSAGFAVRTFPNASAALAAAQSSLPDIVVVDVLMPGLDGFDFCARFRHLPEGDMVPILVTTSLDDTASINQAYCVGATNFASKPINWAVEIHRLNYLLKSADAAKLLRQNEKVMRLAKDEWERTFDSIADVVTVLDCDLKVLRANKAAVKMFGRPITAGCFCYELCHGETQPCALCPAFESLKTGQPVSIEMTGCNGKLFEVTVSPVADEQGRITQLVHVARDLSEKKELEAELRQAQKMEAVGTLAGGIAHDFNNLLTVIQCCAEMIQEDAVLGAENTENLSAIIETSKRGSALTTQLLLFSRKQSEPSRKHPMDLNGMLLALRRMLEKGLTDNITEQYRLAPDLRRIVADSRQLEQVVMNLAVNAAHAMAQGGTLTIETQNIRLDEDDCLVHPDLRSGDYVMLSVSDTGHGMDKHTQSRIYEPFFTTKQVGKGTGLGLSVVFGIVKEHNGCITCQSEVGVGTTFRIYFPVASGSELPAAAPAPDKPALPRGHETILVVDDESHIRTLMERHLVKLGYTVLFAGDGVEALQRYTETSRAPDAVILDLGMPKMSGWECLEKLRELDPRARIFIVSGYGATDLENRARKAGAVGLLRKPYNLREISVKLREILDAETNAAND